MPFPINSHVVRRTIFGEKDRNPLGAILKVTPLNANFLNNSTEYELRPIKPLDLIEMDSLDTGKTTPAIVISVQGETATILINKQGTTGTVNIHNVTIIGYCEMRKFENK